MKETEKVTEEKEGMRKILKGKNLLFYIP